MGQLPKILIAAPTSDYKDYCFKEWAWYINSLTYPNKEVLIVDNSKDPNYHKKIIQHGLPCVYHRPEHLQSLREIVLSGQNLIREKVLKENFDYLFFIESDQFSAPNIIEYLLMQRKHVIGLPYFIHNQLTSKLICFKDEDFGYLRIKSSIYNDEGFLWFDGSTKPCSQLGFGCLLISRSVIEKVPFRVDLNDEHGMYSDSYFHDDCKKRGITVFADTMHMTYHWNGNWKKVNEHFENESKKKK